MVLTIEVRKPVRRYIITRVTAGAIVGTDADESCLLTRAGDVDLPLDPKAIDVAQPDNQFPSLGRGQLPTFKGITGVSVDVLEMLKLRCIGAIAHSAVDSG